MALHFVRYRMAFLGIELGDHDLRTLVRKALRVGAAEALARAGDDRHLVAQPHSAAALAGCFVRRGP